MLYDTSALFLNRESVEQKAFILVFTKNIQNVYPLYACNEGMIKIPSLQKLNDLEGNHFL